MSIFKMCGSHAVLAFMLSFCPQDGHLLREECHTWWY